jgi:hypothetical protein
MSDKSKPKQQQPDEEDSSILANIANSASGLFNSLTRPAATHGLSASGSKSGGGEESATSSSWAESSLRSPQTQKPSAPTPTTADGDFAAFTSAESVFAPKAPPSHGTDGSDVAMLLSLPMATSGVYDDEVNMATVNTSHPAVVAFARCEDPVEFLQARPEWSGYTDAVWGDLWGVLKAADKGKDARATERLKMIWGQLRARL